MAFDEMGLRAVPSFRTPSSLKHIAARMTLSNPWDFFTFTGSDDLDEDDRLLNLECPFDADEEGHLTPLGTRHHRRRQISAHRQGAGDILDL